MNVIVLGARIIGPALAFECVDAFVGAKFIANEERFTRRFKKVLAIEAKYHVRRWLGEPGLTLGKNA